MRIAQAVKTGLLAVTIAGGVFAQDQQQPSQQPQVQQDGPQAAPQTPNSGGWRRIGDPSQSQAASLQQAPGQQAPGPGQPGGPGFVPPPPPPAQLTIAPGTFLTIRLNQVLTSDRNHKGDAFSATLAKPIIVNGIVVADRGQTILGAVTEAKKAGLLHGSSSLGLQVTDLTLADGKQPGDPQWPRNWRAGRGGNRRHHGSRRGRGRGGGGRNRSCHRSRSRLGSRHAGSAVDTGLSDRCLSGTTVDVPGGEPDCGFDRASATGVPPGDSAGLPTAR